MPTLQQTSLNPLNIAVLPTAQQLFVPPTSRERRAQAVHRLQVGMFGLAAMLLLVGLANIIMDRARLADQASALSRPAAQQAASNSDPLAAIGVVPAAENSGATLPRASNSRTPAVR